jgi:hypothetical protein
LHCFKQYIFAHIQGLKDHVCVQGQTSRPALNIWLRKPMTTLGDHQDLNIWQKAAMGLPSKKL